MVIALAAGCVPGPGAPPQVSAAPAASDTEPVSGISRNALAAIVGMSDGGKELLYNVLYYPAEADRAQLAAAPARICRSRGKSVISAEDRSLEHASEFPGTRKLVIRCG